MCQALSVYKLTSPRTGAGFFVAVGVAGVFIETHEDPDNAPSDGPNMVPLDRFEELMRRLMAIDALVKGFA